jgi:hypothetical protein
MKRKNRVSGTTQDNKTSILAELWMEYKNDEEFDDFMQYNDLGLPLAYAISNGIVDGTEQSEKFINETFELLLTILGIEDQGFETLNDLLDIQGQA